MCHSNKYVILFLFSISFNLEDLLLLYSEDVIPSPLEVSKGVIDSKNNRNCPQNRRIMII